MEWRVEETEKTKRYFVRLYKNEEIIKSIKELCFKEGLKSGSIIGIGAIKDPELGYYNLSKKEYKKELIKGEYELLSLIGNISIVEKEPYIHLHVVLGKEDFNTIGGHLFSATVSVTSELIITVVENEIERKKDEETGLNLWKLF